MKWATRANCHIDRMACAWLIRRFIDDDAQFVFVDDPDEVPGDATPFDIRGAQFSHHGGECTFERILAHYDLDDAALQDIARILFMETVIVEQGDTLKRLADWMRARGKERRETIWFRDAEVAEAVDAVLFVGLSGWYPPNYDCGACGYATCADFLNATNDLRKDAQELEFVGPQCNLRDIDLGIAVGSAAKTAALLSVDCRCQTRVAVAARKLGVIKSDVAVALSLSLTHKNVGFDRRFPEVDFDALDLPSTNTLPVAAATGTLQGGARHRQQPRRSPRRTKDD